MNLDLLISDLERSIGSHADSILSSFCLHSKTPEDPIDVLIREFEADCVELASFYSDPKNWTHLGKAKSISSNFIASFSPDETSETPGVLNTISEFEKLTCNKLCALVLENAVAAKESAINALVKTLDYDFKLIRKASLKRLKKMRILDCRRFIPFGKLRAWACDAMKTRGGRTGTNSDGAKAPLTYATAAKCARLRRRLSRVFHFARASHAFTQHQQNVCPTVDPLVARLNQDLMRIRLQLALKLRQQHSTPASPGASTIPINLASNGTQLWPRSAEETNSLSRRFEHLAWDNLISTGVTSETLHSNLQNLIDNITDLLITLGADSGSLQNLIDANLPDSPETVRTIVERSLLSFCHFYSTSVAPDIGSPKHNASLDLFNTSSNEMDDVSASDAECMMDAFDVFDSYVESNAPSRPLNLSYADTSSASNSSSTSSSGRNSPEPQTITLPSTTIILHPTETEPKSKLSNSLPNSVVKSTDHPVTIPSNYNQKKTINKEEAVEEDEGKEIEEEEEEEEECEEGEVIEDPLQADNEEILSETEMTEQAIMREWAPASAEKETKVPYDAAIQKTLENASKSCNRELNTMVTLDISSLPPKQRFSRCDVSPQLDREMSGTTASLRRRRRVFVKHTYRYSREEMQLIRTKIQNSLSRQKASKMLYRKFIRRR